MCLHTRAVKLLHFLHLSPQALLTLSKGVLQDVNSLENTMNKVLLETYQLIPCSVCRYLIIDESTVVGVSLHDCRDVLDCMWLWCVYGT